MINIIEQRTCNTNLDWFIGKNARFDQSSPEQSDHLTLLIVKKILWSTKIGRGWSGTPVFPTMDEPLQKMIDKRAFEVAKMIVT
jgi:hypothetical protein